MDGIKRKPLFLALLALITGYPLVAEEQATAASSSEASPKEKYIRLLTLDSIESNQAFRQSIQKLTAQRQRILQLTHQLPNETDSKKKTSLGKRLEAEIQVFDALNQKLKKTYGFSFDEPYIQDIEKAYLYLFLTEEEAAQLEASKQKE